MNQGKLEVVKQEMARVNVDILGISELKWTGMGEFNSDDHYIYYCGQESLRRNGVAITVNLSHKVLLYHLHLICDKTEAEKGQVSKLTHLIKQYSHHWKTSGRVISDITVTILFKFCFYHPSYIIIYCLS